MYKLVLTVFFINLIFASSVGEDIFDKRCLECHVKYIHMDRLIKNYKGGNKLLSLKAPTLNQMSFQLKSAIGNPKGDKDIHFMEVSEFIADYIINPSKDKSVCYKEVLKVFDTMPSMDGKIDEDEIQEVSNYIYHYDINYSKHIKWQSISSIKNDNKIYLVEVMSDSCYFCKMMDKDVLSNKNIANKINTNLVPIRINKSLGDSEGVFATDFIPSFYFVKNGKIVNKYRGSWSLEDFMEIIDENIE